MPGSLLQLVAIGSEDYYFIGNPQISFFKRVYVRYTNFSIERLGMYNNGSRQFNLNGSKIFNFDIDTTYGDLLYYSTFHIKLPAIYADTNCQFRWIENLGENIIEEAKLFVNDQLIEKIDSGFIHIRNSMDINNNSESIYNHITKNIETVYNPCVCGEYPYSSNISGYFTNASGSPILNKHYSELPTIDCLDLYIPLAFYFNRIPELFVPLTLLRDSNVRIQITLKPVHRLYTIGYPTEIGNGTGGVYYHHESYHKNPKKSILDFVEDKHFYVDCDAQLYNFTIFLESEERAFFSNNAITQSITTPIKYQYLGLSLYEKIKIENSDIIDNIFILPRRSDVINRNQWTNYSIYDYDYLNIGNVFDKTDLNTLVHHWVHRKPSEIPFINATNIDYFDCPNIVEQFSVELDGNILEDFEQPTFFYNHNKYESFKNDYLRDILVYKFSMSPLEYQPSGHLNLGTVEKFALNFKFKDAREDTIPYDFDLNIYLMVFRKIVYDTDSAIIC